MGTMRPVLDLPLCLGLLKHRAPLVKGEGEGFFLPKIFYDGFLLMWCNFKFEGVLFRSVSRHNDRVDCIWEYATSKGPHNLTSTGPHLSLIRH